MPGKVEKSAISINFFKTSAFDYQLLRAVGLHYQGGATIGECLATASRIKDGDVTIWVRGWDKTANLIEKQAEDFLKKAKILAPVNPTSGLPCTTVPLSSLHSF